MESLRFDPPPLHFSDPYQGGVKLMGLELHVNDVLRGLFFGAPQARKKSVLALCLKGKSVLYKAKTRFFFAPAAIPKMVKIRELHQIGE